MASLTPDACSLRWYLHSRGRSNPRRVMSSVVRFCKAAEVTGPQSVLGFCPLSGKGVFFYALRGR